MAIELIGKIKPKNNGAFPLVDAEDVEMPDGTRLSKFKGGVTSVNGQTGDVKITVTDGKDGEDGTDGFSPSISVTAITGGHRVSITDAKGTTTFDVMDGEDGEGASITVDDEISETSENPVQNKVIFTTLRDLYVQVGKQLLPAVTAEDNGKVLQVANGVWKSVSVADSAVKTYIDEYISSALGGEY